MAAKWIVVFGSVIAGAIVLAAASDLRRHVSAVGDHLASSDTRWDSGDPELDAFIERYGHRADVAVSFVGLNAFSLSPENRNRTIHRLGSVALKDSRSFEERGELAAGYREYLLDRFSILSYGMLDGDREEWLRIVGDLRAALGSQSVGEYVRARSAAEELMERGTVPVELRRAHQAMLRYEAGANPAEKSFLVGTDPGSRALNYMILTTPSVVAPDSNVREMLVYEHGSEDSLGTAQVNISKVFAAAKLIRPWFSEALLDDLAPLPEESRVRSFGANGLLRVVPTEVVMHVGEDFVIVPSSDSRQAIARAFKGGRCCRLEGDGQTFMVHSPTLLRIGAHSFRGRTTPSDPRIVAIVSRRRVP